jgi:iron complex transport system ATP-binding protein
MSGVLLSARHCSYAYSDGGFHLRDVSLDVRAGEVLGVVGPNGSGKSTLVRLMSGFYEPDDGEVLLGGEPIHGMGRRPLARRLAFLPQDPESSFRFSVRDVIAMGRFPYQSAFGFMSSDDAVIVREVMEETGTTELADRVFNTLSGGEKQRVLVAGILAQQPRLMLLDEPTAALDIHHQSDVLDLLWRLSRKDIGVVIVTHDLNAASQFCDRLALLSEGRLARVGSTEEVVDEELLRAAYGADVRVLRNPLTAGPLVLVPGESAHVAR